LKNSCNPVKTVTKVKLFIIYIFTNNLISEKLSENRGAVFVDILLK